METPKTFTITVPLKIKLEIDMDTSNVESLNSFNFEAIPKLMREALECAILSDETTDALLEQLTEKTTLTLNAMSYSIID